MSEKVDKENSKVSFFRHVGISLFTGIFVLVLAIISVILFFVLINHEDYKNLAVQEAFISEMILSMLTAVSVIVAMLKIRRFRYTHHRNVELDNILLIVGQIGIYLFSIFSIISGHLAHTGLLNNFVIFSSLSRLIQATLQTIFILDASQRVASSAADANRKPGREMVTFLLVCNFAMWIITTLETGRHDSNSIQLRFFGFWGWTIIARISTPLAIFYRFHSTKI
uniref:Uncharacterized protein n=1 Tax=Strigamia maritima TaxID=126957 RepID=T1JNL2_STRMM